MENELIIAEARERKEHVKLEEAKIRESLERYR
jgi:hypothetical protein